MIEKARQRVRMLRETEPEDCIDFPYAACTMIHYAADLIESLSEQLEQTENKLSELLYYVTGGRYSKTDYSTDDMRRFVDDYNQSTCDECDKCDELEQVTRERDAAIRDIDEAAPCFACIRFERNGGDCIGAHVCVDDILQDALGGKYADYYWQWRGVEVTDDAQKGSDAKS